LGELHVQGKAPASILILGGSSAVGAAAILLLRVAYPFMPIIATSSTKNHDKVLELGATAVIDYKSASVVAYIKAASPQGKGVDTIFDCVSSAATQPDIFDTLDQAGSKRYAEVMTGARISVPDHVEGMLVSMQTIFDLRGSQQLLPRLTRLLEEGKYRVPLPVRNLGHGLENLPGVLMEVLAASGEKLVLSM
jgi:NADPH:quinone reductase-like Zn-dependent oxidoreductase